MGVYITLIFICLALVTVYFIYKLMVYLINNGLYIPINKRFAIRRYVFPKDKEIQKHLSGEIMKISRSTLNGELAPYPFLHGDHSSLSNRMVCLFYDRMDTTQVPIAVHAPFVSHGCGEKILHIGLMMVTPKYQGKGIQTMGSINLVLYYYLQRERIAITEIGSSSSYLSIQDKFMKDSYPDWKEPGKKPKQWHLEIVRHMMKKHRKDFACSTRAVLDEDTLVVRGSNQPEGGGAVSFMTTDDSRQSRDPAKSKFIKDRLDNANGDEQFFIGRPKSFLDNVRAMIVSLMRSK